MPMKLVTRECPQCHETKTYHPKQRFCSRACSVAASRGHRSPQPATPLPILTEQNEVQGDAWTITLPKTRIHTLPQLIEYFEVDESIWYVKRFTANKWEMGSKDNAGNVQVEPLFQVKAFLERKRNVADAKAEIQSLRESLLKEIKPRNLPTPKLNTKGYLLEISIPDPHLGKLCWSAETGHASYDTKIAVQTWERSLATLLARSASLDYERVLFVVGNDLLNADNVHGTTTSGTPQSNDGRFHKVFEEARKMMTRAIDHLATTVAPVDVVVCPGNHDRLSTWCLGHSLECYYHREKHVTIHNAPTDRKYYQWGSVMLMFAHGDEPRKPSDYKDLMSAEQPEMWGACKHREIHVGHRHQVKLEEFKGVRFRILPSLSPPDSWHARNGFVGNKRSAEAYQWHKTDGNVGIAIHTEPEMAAA